MQQNSADKSATKNQFRNLQTRPPKGALLHVIIS
jgi:hypothetical protein